MLAVSVRINVQCLYKCFQKLQRVRETNSISIRMVNGMEYVVSSRCISQINICKQKPLPSPHPDRGRVLSFTDTSRRRKSWETVETKLSRFKSHFPVEISVFAAENNWNILEMSTTPQFFFMSWFTITVLISAVACLLCFPGHQFERRVERESVFTLSNSRTL